MLEISSPSKKLVAVSKSYAIGEVDAFTFDMVLMDEEETTPGLKELQELAQEQDAFIEPEIVIDVDDNVLAIKLHLMAAPAPRTPERLADYI